MVAGSLHLTPSLVEGEAICPYQSRHYLDLDLLVFPQSVDKTIICRHSECLLHYFSSIPLSVAFHQETHNFRRGSQQANAHENSRSYHKLSVLETTGFIKQWNDWSESQLWCQLEVNILKGWSAILDGRLMSTCVSYMVQALAENMNSGTKTGNGSVTSHDYI